MTTRDKRLEWVYDYRIGQLASDEQLDKAQDQDIRKHVFASALVVNIVPRVSYFQRILSFIIPDRSLLPRT